MTENTTTTVILTADDTTAAALVATIKASVNGAGKYAAYVTAHDVTRENVKHHAAALAALVYPNDEPVQKRDGQRTRYGNAVQAAGNGLRAALGKADKPEVTPDLLALILKTVDKGVDGGLDAAKIAEAVGDYCATLLA